MNALKSFLLKNLNPIVLCIAVLCLYAILQIRLGWFWAIGSARRAGDINAIIEGLSYSYLAAALFYLLTMYLPAKRRQEKIVPVIQKRVEEIGSKNIRAMLFEFARETEYGADWKSSTHTAEILKSKDWDAPVPMFQQYNGIQISYLHYLNLKGKQLKERISDIIMKYKEDLTEEQTVVLEELSDMDFFGTIASLSSFPRMTVNGGKDSLVNMFCKMQEKYFEVEKAFKLRD